MKTGGIALLLVLVALALAVPLLAEQAEAGRDLDQDEARQLMLDGRIRPLSELMARHPVRLEGHLLDVELELEDGLLVYEIEVLGADGVVREFYLDAATGQVVKEEIED
ncbi:PepSY domain-containing protein [Marinobacterium weihaiense]|uniref:PepSY domain-containing protein n=1 Tax=Marinobacterium weihaiense TaxID=2851016 RepID=A0ABS6MAY9_9GAMM|nr:PepSY domain-containing protein [Marinobacterium weihaiense]MBV0933466.1 PepSY domain-containing protein [Marinobacterium weihaiense]